MRHAPLQPELEALAPTIAYDHAALLGPHGTVPTTRMAGLEQPTQLMSGGASSPFMRETALALEAAMPNRSAILLEGQTHQVDAAVLAPALTEVFARL